MKSIDLEMDDHERRRNLKVVAAPPTYDGQDDSPTSSRELKGFYAYGLAAEVFAVCGVGSFLPVTLEQLARERGYYWSDKTTPCTSKPPAVPSMAPNATLDAAATMVANTTLEAAHAAASMVANATSIASDATMSLFARESATRDQDQCVVKIAGIEVTTSSFAMYTFSFAVLVQAIALVSFSAVADHGKYRKKLLLGFGFTGAIASMLFIFVAPEIFFIAPILVVIGVTCLGSSFVVLNSYLPLLAGNHPEVHAAEMHHSSSSIPMDDFSRSGSTEQPETHRANGLYAAKQDKDSIALKMSTEISSKGVGIGYAAALFVQLLSIGFLYLMSKSKHSSTLAVRLVLFFVGVWWFGFTIPAYWYLRERPGPPLNPGSLKGNRLKTGFAYVSFAWKSLWKTIKIALGLPQIIVFLVAWFLLSDAVATVAGTAILFARTELQMGTMAVAILSIISTSSGILGAIIWPIISRRFNLKANQTIVICLCLMQIIPLYGLSSYIIPDTWGSGGLRQAWEIYPLGALHGIVMGGLSSYCRSFYGRLIPPGSEVAFYALYAITDKGSSAVGPAVVGYIVDVTGHIRPAFVFLAILIALPIPLMWMVDADKGQADAVMMAAILKKTGGDEEMEGRGDEGLVEAEGLMGDHD